MVCMRVLAHTCHSASRNSKDPLSSGLFSEAFSLELSKAQVLERIMFTAMHTQHQRQHRIVDLLRIVSHFRAGLQHCTSGPTGEEQAWSDGSGTTTPMTTGIEGEKHTHMHTHTHTNTLSLSALLCMALLCFALTILVLASPPPRT